MQHNSSNNSDHGRLAIRKEVNNTVKIEVDNTSKVEVNNTIKIEVNDTIKIEVNNTVQMEVARYTVGNKALHKQGCINKASSFFFSAPQFVCGALGVQTGFPCPPASAASFEHMCQTN